MEAHLNFEFDGMPLKTGSWLNYAVSHEKGFCGVVINEHYNKLPEVDIKWFGDGSNKITSTTSLIYIKPFVMTLSYSENEIYPCSIKLIEWLHVTNRMFNFKLSSDHFKIEADIAYPTNFKS
jgi:hypothetical protein